MVTVPTLTAVEGGATLLVEVTGLPGHPPLWAYLGDDGAWRTIGHVRGIPARLPDRPPRVDDEPAIGAVLRRMIGG